MIISRGRGYIFVHIPKTGGTAMALALVSIFLLLLVQRGLVFF